MEFFTLNLFIKLYSLKVKKGSDSENKSFLSKLEPVNSKLIVSLRPVCSSAYTLIFPESPKLWRYGSNPRSKRPEKKNYHPIILYNLRRSMQNILVPLEDADITSARVHSVEPILSWS